MTPKLVRENPPTTAKERGGSSIFRNLLELAETPGEWGRVVDCDKSNKAAQLASDLRRQRRKVPDGEWEFRHGPIPDSDRFGVWARQIAIESEGANATQTDAG